MGKWPYYCTPTGRDGSNELDLVWIGPVVAEFQHPQDSRSPYHAHGHAHFAPTGKWPCRCTTTDQDNSNEIDLEWIGPVVAEFQHPQDSRSPYHAHRHAHTAPMGKDHAVVHLDDMTVLLNLIWSKSAQGLWSSGVRKIPGPLIMPMGMPIMSPWANDHDVAYLQAKTVPMNLIWVNRPSGCRVRASEVLAGRTDGRADGRTNERTKNIP